MSATSTLKVVLSNPIVDASQVPLAEASIRIETTDGNDQDIPVRIGPNADGTGGTYLAIEDPIIRTITAGLIDGGDLLLPNPALASPLNYRLRISITDLKTNKVSTFRKVLIVGAADNTWDLASLNVGLYLPQMPVAPGMTYRGQWQPNTTYNLLDIFIYGGSTYTPTIGFTSGSTFSPAGLTVIMASGTVTGPQVSRAATRAQSGNVFNPSKAVLDLVLSTAGVRIPVVNDPRFFVSDLIAVYEGEYVVCNTAIMSAATGYPALGYCFYDITGAYISGFPGVAAGTPILVPTGQNIAYISFCCSTGGSDGSGVASTKFYLSNAIPATVDPVLATVAIVNEESDANLIQPETIVRGSNINCVPADPYFATTPTGLDPRFWLSGYFPVVPGGTLISNLAMQATGYNCGLVFFDQYRNALTGSTVAAETPVNVPAAAVWARASGYTSADVASTLVIVNGATLPANYAYPGLSAYTSNQLVSLVGSKPLAGKRWIHFGDSISAIYSPGWLPEVAANTGMIQVGQDAQTGRGTAGIFDMFNGAGGTFNPAAAAGVTNIWANGVSQWLWDSTKTLAQNLVALTPDIITIYLGTNDTGTTPGTPGDATSAGTMCAYVRAAIEPILAAVPNARIMWIAPYPPNYGVSTIPAINQAIKGTCALYGIPVLDLDSQGAICTQTIPYYLLLDPGNFYVHPNSNGCAVLSRLISQFLNSGVGQSASGSSSLIPGVFGASGVGHSTGLVPDPGATAGVTRFLREDGAWSRPSGSNTGAATITLFVAIDTGMPAATYITSSGLHTVVASVANIPFAITFIDTVTGLPWTIVFADNNPDPIRCIQAFGPYDPVNSVTFTDEDTSQPWTWTIASGQISYAPGTGTSSAVASLSLIVLSSGSPVAVSFKSGEPKYTFS